MTTGTRRVPVGERLPTLEDVARLAGVSRATVSRVINGIRNVDPQLHELVWNAVGQTGYVPNRLARSLVTRRTGTVALVVSDSESHDDDPFMGRFFADPYFGRVVGGLRRLDAGHQQRPGDDGHAQRCDEPSEPALS